MTRPQPGEALVVIAAASLFGAAAALDPGGPSWRLFASVTTGPLVPWSGGAASFMMIPVAPLLAYAFLGCRSALLVGAWFWVLLGGFTVAGAWL